MPSKMKELSRATPESPCLIKDDELADDELFFTYSPKTPSPNVALPIVALSGPLLAVAIIAVIVLTGPHTWADAPHLAQSFLVALPAALLAGSFLRWLRSGWLISVAVGLLVCQLVLGSLGGFGAFYVLKGWPSFSDGTFTPLAESDLAAMKQNAIIFEDAGVDLSLAVWLSVPCEKGVDCPPNDRTYHFNYLAAPLNSSALPPQPIRAWGILLADKAGDAQSALRRAKCRVSQGSKLCGYVIRGSAMDGPYHAEPIRRRSPLLTVRAGLPAEIQTLMHMALVHVGVTLDESIEAPNAPWIDCSHNPQNQNLPLHLRVLYWFLCMSFLTFLWVMGCWYAMEEKALSDRFHRGLLHGSHNSRRTHTFTSLGDLTDEEELAFQLAMDERQRAKEEIVEAEEMREGERVGEQE
ncbi:unnamed protein product [Vitrella brassicaformis CCMP3155]|uniref:Uncharacterized protein n=1 Tax=Vitrella brassicaformis (strain CCMP3155) TaxID=1169540 RepID=A0A0G4FLI5_VITBC|nr:unnamed protein product [Vitrella brassicaformis CCMP3155]|eukprot:CEM14783.1 unnamed protein product [Vitrella brassicaformis CCMP3155]